MFLENPNRNPRILLRIGMVCFLIFNLVNYFGRRWVDAPWRDWTDGLAGLTLGLYIGLMLMVVRLRARQLRGEGNPPCASR